MGKASKQFKNRRKKHIARINKENEFYESIKNLDDNAHYIISGFTMSGKAWKNYYNQCT